MLPFASSKDKNGVEKMPQLHQQLIFTNKTTINNINKLEARVSLYRSPDINKPHYECLHVE